MHWPRIFGTLALGAALCASAGCCSTRKCHSFTPLSRASQYASCDGCADGPTTQSRFVPAPPPPPPWSPPRVPELPPTLKMPPGSLPPADSPPPRPPADPNVRLYPPEPPDGPDPLLPRVPNAPPPSVRLSPPRLTDEPPLAKDTPPPADRKTPEEQPAPALPVDIPGFAPAKPKVAAGLQPFPEGVQWLRDQGYRTVLHVRAPGENEAAAQRLFTGRGLRYLSLEVSPKTLTPALVEQFNTAVADPANLPLFVYDKDGSLAGGLWYLHFRTAEKMSDEKARQEAARLGFNPDADGAQRTMWVAIQAYLRDNP